MNRQISSRTWIVLFAVWQLLVSAGLIWGYLAFSDLSRPLQNPAGRGSLQVLENRVTELADTIERLPRQPEPEAIRNWMQAELDRVQGAWDTRLAALAQSLTENRGWADELHTLQAEIETLKANQLKTIPRTLKPRAVSESEPPFRILGVERRADKQFLSLAPPGQVLSFEQVRIAQPGETLNGWQLEAIDGKSAIFRVRGRTRRLPIP
jgi:hypothetical protein